MSKVHIFLRWQVFVGLLAWVLAVSAQPEWAWLYRKSFTSGKEAASAKELLFTRLGIPCFTQLLCSWNALRPQKGYFGIYLQARDQTSKRWGRWHHIADWGAGVQRSFMDKADLFDQFVHVRLEIDKRHRADGFRVKVVSQDEADLRLLKGLAVNVANFDDFRSENVAGLQELPSVAIAGMPRISQFALDHVDSDKICSPASCTMLASFLSRKQFDPLKFAKNVYDFGLGVYGSWPFNVAHAFEATGGRYRFAVTRLNSFVQLHRQLMRGLPVVASVRGPLNRAARPYAGGHLLVVTGWDAKTREVISNDPAFERHELVQQRYELSEFLAAWQRSHRLTYLAESIV